MQESEPLPGEIEAPEVESGVAGAVRRSDSLWRHDDFRRLWIGDTISQVGTQLTQLALPVLAVTLLAATPREMGYLVAAETAAFLLVGLPAGAWVDRWRKRRVLILADVIRAVVLGTLPVTWALQMLTMVQVYAVALVMGVATVFFDVAYQSFLPELVDGEQLVEGNAKLQASASVAEVVGPALGGQLLRVLAAPLLLLADAMSFLASAVLLSRITARAEPPQRAVGSSLRTEIAEGLRFVLRHPLLARIAACTATSNLFSAMSGAVFVIFVLKTLGLDVGALGLIFSIGAVGGLLGAVIAAPAARVVGEGRVIPLSAVIGGAAHAVQPLAVLDLSHNARIVLLASSGFVISVSVVVYNVTQVSFRQRITPPPLLGRMNASIRFLVWGVMPIGGLLGGFFGEYLGVVPTMWVTAIGTILAAFPVLLSPLIRMRDLPAATSR